MLEGTKKKRKGDKKEISGLTKRDSSTKTYLEELLYGIPLEGWGEDYVEPELGARRAQLEV